MSDKPAFPSIVVAHGEVDQSTLDYMNAVTNAWTARAARGECAWVCSDCCQYFPDGMPETCCCGHQSCTGIIQRDKRAAKGNDMDMVTVPKRVVDLLAQIQKDGVIQRASELQEVYRLIAAHSAGAQEPVVWRHSKTLCLYETEDAVPLADGDEWAEPLYAHPQPMADVARDVEFEITPEIASEWARRQDIEHVLKDFSTQRCAIEDARTLHLAEIERLDREGE